MGREKKIIKKAYEFVPPSESLTGFLDFCFSLRYFFSFSALSKYCAHFALMLSFALSLVASSKKMK